MSDPTKPDEPGAEAEKAAPAATETATQTVSTSGPGPTTSTVKTTAEIEISSYSAWNLSPHEIGRLLFQLTLIFACFYPDFGAMRTMTYVLGVFMAVTFITHITRKYVLFSYIDLRELYNRARMEPLASAIVFASVCAVIITCMNTAAQFFVR